MKRISICLIIAVALVISSVPAFSFADDGSKNMKLYVFFLTRANPGDASNLVKSEDQYGDAALIESDGHFLLIDTGDTMPNKDDPKVHYSTLRKQLFMVDEENNGLLRKNGMDVLITHSHKDHVYALPELCSEFKVNKIYISSFTENLVKVAYDEEMYRDDDSREVNKIKKKLQSGKGINKKNIKKIKAFLKDEDILQSLKSTEEIIESAGFEMLENSDAELKVLNVGDTISCGSVNGKVLGPVGDFKKSDFKEWDGVCGSVMGHYINNMSMSVMFTCGSVKYLNCGDIEEDEEQLLVKKYGDNLKADIFKTSHHGLFTSSTEEFMEKVSPTYNYVQNHGFILSLPSTTITLNQYSNHLYKIANMEKSMRFIVNGSKPAEEAINAEIWPDTEMQLYEEPEYTLEQNRKYAIEELVKYGNDNDSPEMQKLISETCERVEKAKTSEEIVEIINHNLIDSNALTKVLNPDVYRTNHMILFIIVFGIIILILVVSLIFIKIKQNRKGKK